MPERQMPDDRWAEAELRERSLAVRPSGVLASARSAFWRSGHLAFWPSGVLVRAKLNRMRPIALLLFAVACSSGSVSPTERQAITDSLTRQVKAAYDVTKPNLEQRLLSLYPESGRI